MSKTNNAVKKPPKGEQLKSLEDLTRFLKAYNAVHGTDYSITDNGQMDRLLTSAWHDGIYTGKVEQTDMIICALGRMSTWHRQKFFRDLNEMAIVVGNEYSDLVRSEYKESKGDRIVEPWVAQERLDSEIRRYVPPESFAPYEERYKIPDPVIDKKGDK